MGGCTSSSNNVKNNKNKSNGKGNTPTKSADKIKLNGSGNEPASTSTNNEVYFVTGVSAKQNRNSIDKQNASKKNENGNAKTTTKVKAASKDEADDLGRVESPSGDYDDEAPDVINIAAIDVHGESLSDPNVNNNRAISGARSSTLSVRSITEEVKGNLSRTGSLQEMLVSLHEEESNIRSSYTGIDSEARSSVLGKGNWGTVKVVIRKRDNQKFACKELVLSEKMPNAQFEELKSEIESLSRLDHPQIARLYEAFEEPGKKLYLVMELLTGGELYTRLVEEAPGGKFNEKKSATLAKRMCCALSYLHGQGIVHRDLKLENFVFRDRDPDSDRMVLIDFGLAKKFGSGKSVRMSTPKKSFIGEELSTVAEDETVIMNSVVGSSYYIAPEVLDGRYSGPLCDIWSMGVIVYMMLCGKAPFNGKTEALIMKRAQTGEYSMNGASWDMISDEGKDFVSRCLTKDVNRRITAADALKHPWIEKSIVSSLCNSDGTKKDNALPLDVIQNLVIFSVCPAFIRIGCQAAAFSFARSEIAEVADLFEVIDSNSDGYVVEKDIKEAFIASLDGTEDFLEHYSDIGAANKKIEAAASDVFAAMDTEGIGLVRFTYFISAAVHADKYYREMSVLKEAFNKLDHGRKGYVEYKDLERLNFSKNRAQEIITDFLELEEKDTNNPQKAGDKEPCIEFKDFLLSMRRNGSKSEVGVRGSSMRKKSSKSKGY